MKRFVFVFLLAILLVSNFIPAEASSGPRDRRHPRRGPHQVTCVTQAAQEAAYAWMNGLRGYGDASYTARFRHQTLAYARTEPGWFRAKVRRAARLQDQGRKQKAVGQLWKAVEMPCR